jgi:hypothetical protein
MWPPPRPARELREAIAAKGSADSCAERRRFVTGGERRREAEREESDVGSRVWAHKMPSSRYIWSRLLEYGGLKTFYGPGRVYRLSTDRSLISTDPSGCTTPMGAEVLVSRAGTYVSLAHASAGSVRVLRAYTESVINATDRPTGRLQSPHVPLPSISN